MKVGTVVVVKETGQLGLVEAVVPPNEMWSDEWLMVRTSKRGEPEYFPRQDVTQIYKPRTKVEPQGCAGCSLAHVCGSSWCT